MQARSDRVQLQILPLDVTKATDIETTAKLIGTRLDLLINNVGFSLKKQYYPLISTGCR